MNISLPSDLKRFVEIKVKEGTYADESEVVNHALRFFKDRDVLRDAMMSSENIFQQPNFAILGSLSGSDIEALAFLVLMEAAKSAQEDLKAIMAHVKAINNAKQAMRDLMNRVNKDAASNTGQRDKKSPLDFSSGMGSEKAYHKAQMPSADSESECGVRFTTTDLHIGKIVDVVQLRAISDGLKSDLDSMSEMGEIESLRLQIAMDRLSRMMSTLWNLLKKISDTQSTIVQNLK